MPSLRRLGIAVAGGTVFLLFLASLGRSGITSSAEKDRVDQRAYDELLALTTTANTDWNVKQAFFTFRKSTNPVVRAILAASANETTQRQVDLCRFIKDMSDVVSEIKSERTMEMLRSMDEIHRDAALSALEGSGGGNRSNATHAGSRENGTQAAGASPTELLLAKYGCGNQSNGTDAHVDEGGDEGYLAGGGGSEMDNSGGQVLSLARRDARSGHGGLSWPGQIKDHLFGNIQGGAGEDEREGNRLIKTLMKVWKSGEIKDGVRSERYGHEEVAQGGGKGVNQQPQERQDKEGDEAGSLSESLKRLAVRAADGGDHVTELERQVREEKRLLAVHQQEIYRLQAASQYKREMAELQKQASQMGMKLVKK